jgi:glycosyltransferase involved in cell wall biosynthesis
MNACTIIARNYLPHARVLAESLLEHHPDGRLTTLVIDLPEGETVHESFDVLTPYEIGLDRPEVHRMAMIYDLMEFATAVKPFLLKTLLAEGASDVMYLDPDIRIFAPLADISALACKHSIVLTPHTTEPLPRDGLLPDDQMILGAGIYNLGFIAVGPQTEGSFLEWWSERLARDSRVAFEESLFVDQRWIDFVPALFEHYVLRDPTINVAYWNLHDRDLRWSGKRYEVNGRPLRFFHFSGFDPRSPGVLSARMGMIPRIRFSDHPNVARLCAEYTTVLAHHGFRPTDDWSYRFDVLPDGRRIDRQLRALFRGALLVADEGRAPFPPDPFEPASQDAFVRWLGHRNGSGTVELGGPEKRRRHRPRSMRGRRSGPAGQAITASNSGKTVGSRRQGVNVIGYLEAELGLGEIGRKLVSAVECAGLPTSTMTYRRLNSRQEHRFEDRGRGDMPYDTTIICVNPPELQRLRAELGPGPFAGRYTIGVWFWELACFPAELHFAFDLVDEVWVASEFTHSAISAETAKPVRIVPIPLEAPPTTPLDREELGLPDGFLYLFSFDHFSILERKNPVGLVDAFKRAFAPGEGPILLIRSINGDQCPTSLERLQDAAKGRGDIRIVDGYLSETEKNAVFAECDCYVSLHRSEGLGLTMAEAMSAGKPVIGTGYSGNLTFMDEGNSYLVRHGLTRVPEACEPYPAGLEWAEPDLDHAAELMRRVYEQPWEARQKGQRARNDIGGLHTIDRTAAFIRERLKEIPRRERLFLDVRGPLEHAAAMVETAPGVSLENRAAGSWAVRALRLILRRALWPELAEQRRLDSALIESLRALERVSRTELDALRRDAGRNHQRIQELERIVAELLNRQK